MSEEEIIEKIHEICKKYYPSFTIENDYSKGLTDIDRRIKFSNLIEKKAKEEIENDYYDYKYDLDYIIGYYNNKISDSFLDN